MVKQCAVKSYCETGCARACGELARARAMFLHKHDRPQRNELTATGKRPDLPSMAGCAALGWIPQWAREINVTIAQPQARLGAGRTRANIFWVQPRCATSTETSAK